MANNTNAQAIAFSNNYARVLANDMVSCYLSMKRAVQVWTGQSIVTVIPNDANLIQDGATVASGTPDGRAPITDAQVNVLISNMNTLIAQFEASSNLILNQTMQVQVNAVSVVN
jgi:hypothetical protein